MNMSMSFRLRGKRNRSACRRQGRVANDRHAELPVLGCFERDFMTDFLFPGDGGTPDGGSLSASYFLFTYVSNVRFSVVYHRQSTLSRIMCII
jgi:hypothetical protein